jgi:hypothetical protein
MQLNFCLTRDIVNKGSFLEINVILNNPFNPLELNIQRVNGSTLT